MARSPITEEASNPNEQASAQIPSHEFRARDHLRILTSHKEEDIICLVAEHSRIVNRMKSVFALLGIRGFNPKLKRAADRLQSLRTPEGEPIPPHAIAALKRDMERRQLIR